MASREVSVARLPDATVEIRVAGRWQIGDGDFPSTRAIEEEIDLPTRARRLAFDATALSFWDSSLLVFVERIRRRGRALGVTVDATGLPMGLQRLLALADARSGEPPPRPGPSPSGLTRVGLVTLAALSSVNRTFGFIGEMAIAFGALVVGQAHYRKIDLLSELETAGINALPIITLVSFLLGMILAFVGWVTLRPFGATIYVAYVVTVSMVRELGPVMTAIVMAGRTGSAYAAEIGTMKVSQEVDALTTMGLPPVEFLVLPRLLSLSLMVPLLTVYAEFVSLLGGGVVASATGTSPVTYLHKAQEAITLTTFWIGLVKASVFGVVVATCGCLEGLRAEASAAAVGRAATQAVVASIVWVIAIDGVFAVLLYLLGI